MGSTANAVPLEGSAPVTRPRPRPRALGLADLGLARDPRAFDPTGWRDQALCRSLETNLFFPIGEIGPDAVEHARRAKAVCQECPVRDECLEFALATHQEYGVWGGLTERELRDMRRARRRRRLAR